MQKSLKGALKFSIQIFQKFSTTYSQVELRTFWEYSGVIQSRKENHESEKQTIINNIF